MKVLEAKHEEKRRREFSEESSLFKSKKTYEEVKYG